MAQSAEYSFDELTDMILLYGEAERNSTAAARLYAERYPQRRMLIVGHSLLWNVVCEKYIVCGPLWQTLVDHEVAEAPMWKVFRML
jgi:hypothetical protein